MKKLSVKQNLTIANLIMCVGGVVTLVDMFQHGGKARLFMVGVGFLFILVGLGYRTATVKCPHCDDPLTGTWRLPKECPKCGHDLTGRSE